MFYRLLHGNEAKFLSKSSREVGKELKDFREFVALYQRKLKLLRDFTGRIDRQRNISATQRMFNEMKECFLSVDKLEFVVDERDIKTDRDLVSTLDRLEQEDISESAPIELIKQHLAKLFQIRRLIGRLVQREMAWFSEHPSFTPKFKRTDVQLLVRLVRREGELLFANGLSGFKGEKELLAEIYNIVMPLKERVKKKELRAGKAATPVVWEWIDGRVRVMKWYGSIKAGRKWSLDQARIRFDNIRSFYAFLKSAGINVPDHNTFRIVAQYKKTPSGIKPTGHYQIALVQNYIGKNAISVFRETISKRKIIYIYRQMLEQINKAIDHGLNVMVDFGPANFCLDRFGKVVFVDTEPAHVIPRDPHKVDIIVRTDIPLREQMAIMTGDLKYRGTSSEEEFRRERRWIRVKRGTPMGIFMNLLIQCTAVRIELKQELEELTIDFLRIAGKLKEARALKAMTNTKRYTADMLKYVKRYAPENLAKAEVILMRK